MKDIDLVKFYKSVFQQQNLDLLISFETFQDQVRKYIKDMGCDLDEEIAARLVAQKYKTKQHEKICINQLSHYLSRHISISGNVQVVSELKTTYTQGNTTQYKYLVIADNTGKARVTFWQQDIQLLQNIFTKQDITIYGYVSSSPKYGSFLRPSRLQKNQTTNTTMSQINPKIESLIENYKVANLRVLVLDYLQNIKYSKVTGRELTLHSYLVQDDSAMIILNAWEPLNLNTGDSVILSNLTVGKFKQLLNLKPLYKVNVDIEKCEDTQQINISDFNFTSLSNLKPNLIYNVTIQLTEIKYIVVKKSDSQNVKPISKFIFKDEENKLITFVDWDDKFSSAINCKEINDFVTFKFVGISKYNDTFVVTNTEFTFVE